MDVKKVIIIILDSVGVGELPDASRYDDIGSNTLSNTARAVGGVNLPYFQELGLGNIVAVEGVPPAESPKASYGKMGEKSAGKDTTTGHWELMGLYLEKPFPTYPNGFPLEIIEPFEERIGSSILGNKPASGTEIIKELGDEHIKTGNPIVYTSVDSVFQIAAHEQIIPIERLYEICQIAREILTGRRAVARVIARPFVGKVGGFVRTERRRDFSLPPPDKTVLDYAVESGFSVYTVGKVDQIFAQRGITDALHTKDNMDGIDKTIELMEQAKRGIIFTNLVDFDMLWGHRNNPKGYAQGLEQVDERVPEVLNTLKDTDVLIFTADHGCDPTTPSTDHSREYIPLLIYGKEIKQGIDIGVRETFADVGKTAAHLLGFEVPTLGSSFSDLVLKK